jgi:DNA/RNA endonuclease YhcR with UshA esterase domain
LFAQYIGENVEVQGIVAVVYTSKNGNTFLDFGGRYPRQTFTGYIPAGSELAGNSWTASLDGKTIGITGTVEVYKGKPEIKVLSKSQIKANDWDPAPMVSGIST